MIRVLQRNRWNSILYKVNNEIYQGFHSIRPVLSSTAFYKYALLLLRKSEGDQRSSNRSQLDNDDDVRVKATDFLQQKNHKRRR